MRIQFSSVTTLHLPKVLLALFAVLAATSGFADYTFTVPGGGAYTPIANHLNHGPNTLSVLFPNAQDGDQIFYWDCTTGDFSPTIPTYSSASHQWSVPNATLVPGEGAFYVNNGIDTTITFTGTPVAPVLPVSLSCGCGSYYLLSSQTATIGTWESIVGTLPPEGALFMNWDEIAFDWVTNAFTGCSWTNGVPTARVGESVMVFIPCSTNQCPCPPQPLPLFNTGIGTNGTPLAGGAIDPHYAFTTNPSGAAYAFVVSPLPTAWLTNSSTSQWIGPTNNGSGLDGATYVYEITFTVPCTNNAYITGQWAADDTGAIILNGSGPPVATIAGTDGATSWHPFAITSALVPGQNTLDFYVTNSVSATGLRVELSGSATCCIDTNCCAGCTAPYPLSYTNIIQPGINYLADNLCQGTNNTLDEVLADVPDGTVFQTWDNATQTFDAPLTYFTGLGWYDSANNPATNILTPGEGFLLDNTSGATFTLVIQGCPPMCPPPCTPSTNGLSLVGQIGLGTTTFTNAFGIWPTTWTNLFSCPPPCGARMSIWNGSGFTVYNYANGVWTPFVPGLAVGQSVFVSVQPNTNCCPLVITCPSDVVVSACTNVQRFYSPTASNVCCGTNVVVTCAPPSGSYFAPGTTTTVACQAVDCHGITNHCSFTVTVLCNTNSPPCCPETGGVKYLQPPDLANGIDVNATFYPQDPVDVVSWVLADDFPCTNSGPITDIHVWGSWMNDQVDPNAIYTLAIWSDAPTNSGNTGFSHPAVRLWTETYTNGQYAFCHYTNRLENFGDGFGDPYGASSNLFYLCFDASPANTFHQTGTPTAKTNYWLSLAVQSLAGPSRYFGWKSSSVAYNDTAVAAFSGSFYPQPGDWTPIADFQGLPLNLAFKITTATNPCSLVIGCPSDIVALTCSNCALVSYAATATDLCCTNGVTLSYNPPSGSCFPLGPSTVTVTATDGCSNVATCSFKVSVLPCTLTNCIDLVCPSDLAVTVCRSNCAVVNFAASATDFCCTNGLTLTYNPAPGSCFPLGTNVVGVTASDGCGNVATGSFLVTVGLVTNPPVILSGPTNVTICAGTQVSGRVIVDSDEWDTSDAGYTYEGDGPVYATNCANYLTSNGAHGRKILICSDNFSLTGGGLTASLTAAGYTVVHSVPPLPSAAVLSGYNAVYVAGDAFNAAALAELQNFICSGGGVYIAAGTGTIPGGAAGEAAQWNSLLNGFGLNLASTYDLLTGVLLVPSTLQVTASPVMAGVTALFNDNGNNVNVLGGYPLAQVVAAHGAQGLIGVSACTTTGGGCGPMPDLTSQVTVSGGTFSQSIPPGTILCANTNVSLRVTNACGAATNLTIPVILTACSTNCLSVQCPADIVALTCSNCALVSYAATATDLCCTNGVTLSYNPPSGSCFPLGPSTVTVTATDGCSNVATCSFKVSVLPCAITNCIDLVCPSDIAVTVCRSNCAVVTFAASATDFCCTNGLTLTYNPAPGSCFPLGTNVVGVTASDGCGNVATGSFLVTVSLVTNPPVILSGPTNVTICAGTQVSGRVIVDSDEWDTSDAGYTYEGDGAVYATNCANYLTSNGAHGRNILICSDNFSLTGGALTASLTAAGYTVVHSVPPLPSAAVLSGYNAVYVAGDAFNAAALAELQNFICSGGGVYIAAGTGTIPGAAAGEAAQWNSLLNGFGLNLASTYDLLTGVLLVPSTLQVTASPVMAGVTALFNNNGNNVNVLGGYPLAQVVAAHGAQGLIGVSACTTAGGGCGPMPDLTSQVTVSGGTFSQSIPPGTILCANTNVSLRVTNACGAATNLTIPVILTACSTNCLSVQCPADIVALTCSNCALVSYAATATDLCCTNGVTLSYNPPSGSCFPLGPSTVTVTATDGCSNVATCSFKVSVLPCAITNCIDLVCPSDIAVTVCRSNCAVVTFAASATDFCCTNGLTLTYNPAPGSCFPLGTNVVGVTASDGCGNVATGSFLVTVSLVTNPPVILSGPTNVTICAGTQVSGRVIVDSDEWDTSDAGYTYEGDGSVYATNCANYLTSNGAHGRKILICSDNFSLTGGDLTASLTAAGYTVVHSVPPLPSAAVLSGYNAVYVAGDAFNAAALAELQNFICSGGGVYIAAGTGTIPGAAAGEAAQWNSLLNGFGLNLASTYDLLTGVLLVPSTLQVTASPVMAGVTALFNDNGNNVNVLGGYPLAQVVAAHGAQGLIGVSACTTAGGGCGPMPDLTSQVTVSGGTFSQSIPPGTILCANTNVSLRVTNACGAATNLTIPVILTACSTNCLSVQCPADIVALTCSNCALVSYAATATDLCCTNGVTLSYNPPSGSCFPLGPSTVTVTATDGCSNVATCSFKVSVLPCTVTNCIDLVCPSDIAVTVCRSNCAVVTFAASATDFCCTNGLTLTYNPAPGSCFPLGTNVVGVTASDGCGNVATGSFLVTVSLVTNPPVILSGPTNVTICAGTQVSGRVIVDSDEWDTSDAGYTYEGDGSVYATNCANYLTSNGAHGRKILICSDNFSLTGGDLTASLTAAGYTVVHSVPPLPSAAVLSGYNAVYVAGDAFNAAALAELQNFICSGGGVYIAAGTASIPGGAAAEAAQWNSLLNGFGLNLASTYDLLTGVLLVPSTLQVTASPVMAGVTALFNDNGNNVNVLGGYPLAQVVAAHGAQGLIGVSACTTAGGGCGLMPDLTSQVTVSGGTFSQSIPPGTILCANTNVSLRVTNACGAATNLTIPVILTACSTNCLSVQCPADIVALTCSNCALVSYAATATDLCCTNGVTLSYNPPSGSCFPLGPSTVTVTATDGCSNVATCSFKVSVLPCTVTNCIDLVCPSDIAVTVCRSNCAVVTFAASATDFCCTNGLTLTYNPAPGSCFPLGTNVVGVTASDGCGNVATGSFLVTVSLVTNPPVILSGPTNVTICAGTQVSGRVIVDSDEWDTSDAGYTYEGDGSVYATNCANYLTSNGAHGRKILICSDNFSLTGGDLTASLTAAGYTVVHSVPPLPSAAVLSGYNAVYVAGDAFNAAALAELQNFICSGGGVYIAAGTASIPGGAAAEAAQWNSLLNGFGLNLASTYDLLTGVLLVPSTLQVTASPVMAGVTALFNDNGNNVNVLGGYPLAQVVAAHGAQGLIGVSGCTTTGGGCGLMPDLTSQVTVSGGTFSQSIPPGTILCANTNVSLTVTNACGAATNLTIPVILTACSTNCLSVQCPTNKTVYCSSTWTFDAPMATTCCTNLTYTLLRTNVTLATSCETVYAGVWQVTDSCGNSSICTQLVTVLNSGAPVLVPGISLDYSTLPGAGISFASGGFTFVGNGSGVQFEVDNVFNGAGDSIGFDGYISSGGPFAIGPITINGSLQTAPVTGNGILHISDGVHQLTGTIQWVDISTVGTSGVLNLNGVVNLTGIAYPGTSLDLQSLAASGAAEVGLTFQFIPGKTLTQLAATGGFSGFSGTVVGSPVLTTPPLLTCSTNKTVPCGDNWSFDPPVPDAGCCTNWTILVLENVTNDLGGPCATNYRRTWQVTDCCSNTAICSQTVTVVHTNPPVINCVSNKTVQCGTAWSFDTPTAGDNCSGTNVAFTFKTETNGFCPQVITRTWTATDLCGNTNTCSQTVTIVVSGPPTAPVIVGWAYDAAGMHIIIQTYPCYTYALEYKNSLTDPTWTTSQTATGDGTNHEFIDPPPLPPARYYRVRLLCP